MGGATSWASSNTAMKAMSGSTYFLRKKPNALNPSGIQREKPDGHCVDQQTVNHNSSSREKKVQTPQNAPVGGCAFA